MTKGMRVSAFFWLFLRLSASERGVLLALWIAILMCFVGYPRLVRCVVSSDRRLVSVSVWEQILTSLNARLYGMLFFVWKGWQEDQWR